VKVANLSIPYRPSRGGLFFINRHPICQATSIDKSACVRRFRTDNALHGEWESAMTFVRNADDPTGAGATPLPRLARDISVGRLCPIRISGYKREVVGREVARRRPVVTGPEWSQRAW